MDFYVINALTDLGIIRKISDSFPTPDEMIFIEKISSHSNMQHALNASPEETNTFEKDGLRSLVTAKEFFDKLCHVSRKGSYSSASIRMDVQISTRMMKNAPNCEFNMLLKTKDWHKTLNISPATTEKLLDRLLEARAIIRQSKEPHHAEIE